MAAIITDQFRIFSAENFVDSVNNNNNSYYVFLGLPNPAESKFGRSTGWDLSPDEPVDNLQYLSHYKDTLLFGKKITSSNVRRIVRKVTWTENTRYEMYRHDYSTTNLAPVSELPRLYDCNYYVLNSDYRVYICIDNGSSSTNTTGNKSQDEPTFTDADPSAAGSSGDGYVWKYLFTLLPSDIIKFDSTEYIVLPENWSDTSTDSEIQRIRDAGNSDVEENQIKKIYIANAGSSYLSRDEEYSVDINGDGTGATASIKVTDGKIVSARVTYGGKGYTYGIVDLGSLRAGTIQDNAQLIVIIPPSKGHGYDIYKELGADRVLIYARFDDLTEDTPISTAFAQVGILKNPKYSTSDTLFEENQFSSLYAIKLSSISETPVIGEQIFQVRESDGKIAKGYVASYDSNTEVLKYFRDRSLYFSNGEDETDDTNVTDVSEVLDFESSSDNEIQFVTSAFSAPIDITFNENKVTKDSKVIDLGVTFVEGLANPEINKKTGDIIYVDNRPLVTRNLRQKEDVKIILEF